jgi:arylsulfatase A-like enzyme
MYDADSMPGARKTERVSWGIREEETLAAIQSQIQKYARGKQRFFLTYIPVAPHFPYDGVPASFHRFKPSAYKDYTSRYLNGLLYMDWVIASIVDQLKDSGLLDKTVVVITDDHGEMLGANGGPIGHGWALTPELANVPLIVIDPEKPGYRLNYTVGSQIDLLPTLLDLLRIPLPPGQLYEGHSLYGPNDGARRLVYLNSGQQYGILASNHFIFLGDRQAPDGRGEGPRLARAISNQGSATVFSEQYVQTPMPLSISRFDEFQENLLHNYSYYCQVVLQAGRPDAKLAPSR